MHRCGHEERILQLRIRPVVAQPAIPQPVEHHHGFTEAIDAIAWRRRREAQHPRCFKRMLSGPGADIEPPPEMQCTVTAFFASIAGCRNATLLMSVPSRTRVV